MFAQKIPYDIDEAKEICSTLPLDALEGIWIYPEDRVTVMIIRDRDKAGVSSLPIYRISVVEGEDCRLHAGDIIGEIGATAEPSIYSIRLFTESKNNILGKPVSCSVKLTNENETLVIKRSKSSLKYRLNINFNRLLPGFWKIVSSGISKQNTSESSSLPVGMIKIFPSYDGNGSSRRQPRYL